MSAKMTVLCAAKLHANQLERHLELFEHIPEVERVLVVRHKPIAERLSKVQNRPFREGSRPVEALRMMRAVSQTIPDENVDWVIGFNPVPWGSLAFAAARAKRVPTCLSLIGMDFLQIQRPWGRPFLQAVKHATRITVTGQRMAEGLKQRGVAAKKIHILPHSVDTKRFVPSEGAKEFDIIAVGQLITRKRMDVLISAVAQLKKRGVSLRVGILGKGPEEGSLKGQAADLGVSDLVQFLGYRDDVESILNASKAFCLCSEWEGVPFALMEAMSAGLVPVVTDVGTISDWISDGINGCMVPVGNVDALAERLTALFAEENQEYRRLRAQLLTERDRLSFHAGAQVWRKIFGLDEEP